MSTINSVFLIGNVAKDPEMKVSPNGGKIAIYTLATNHVYLGPNGERNDEAEFHRCVAFGKLAEIFEKYVTKGKKLHIQGRLRTRNWENEDGKKQYLTEIITEKVVIL